jgi:hypothetical protein
MHHIISWPAQQYILPLNPPERPDTEIAYAGRVFLV